LDQHAKQHEACYIAENGYSEKCVIDAATFRRMLFVRYLVEIGVITEELAPTREEEKL
jgi:hypothetical protein